MLYFQEKIIRSNGEQLNIFYVIDIKANPFQPSKIFDEEAIKELS